MKEWNEERLAAFLEARSSGLLFFYTPLCGTCQVASKMLHVIDEIINMEIGQINLNFHANLAVNYEIESVPCLILIKKGRTAENIYAFHSVPFLLNKIKTFFHADA